MVGSTFGRWTVLKIKSEKGKRTKCLCRCSCGTEKYVDSSSLRSGSTKSCGCLKNEMLKSGLRTTHGLRNHPLYIIWCHMKHRCYNKNNKRYNTYGKLGVKLIDEWLDFKNFHDWSIANGYKKGLSIERKNPTGDYSPSNCTFIPMLLQPSNRRNSMYVEFEGQQIRLIELCQKHDVDYNRIWQRIKLYGWTVERAISEPSKQLTGRK